MHFTRRSAGVVTAVMAVAAITAIQSCARESPTTPTQSARSRQLTLKKFSEASAATRAAVQEALARQAWAGNAHTAAMRELIRREDEWKGKDLNTRCAVLADVMLKAMPGMIQSAGARPRSNGEIRSALRDVMKVSSKCAGPDVANVFYSMGSGTPGDDWDMVLAYAEAMTQAVMAAEGDYSNPGAVSAAVYDALASASPNVSSDGLNFLAVMGSVDISSANEWEAYYSVGGGGYGTGNLSMPEPMNVFRAGWFSWVRAGKIAAADAWSGYMGFKYAGVLGIAEPLWGAVMVGACAIVGSYASYQLTK